MTIGKEDSAFTEPKYENDMNNFMKWDKLGKGSEYTPKLSLLIAFAKKDLRRSISGQPSAREVICDAIS